MCVTSGFHHDVEEICALLGYYAAQSGNHAPTVRDNPSVPSSRDIFLDFLNLEDGVDRLSRNVGTQSPLCAAQYRRTEHISFKEYVILMVVILLEHSKFSLK